MGATSRFIFASVLLLATTCVVGQSEGLIAAYDFANLTDSSENLIAYPDESLNGIIMGNPTPVGDRFGNPNGALQFHGGDKVVVQSASQINPLPFSVSVWYKPDLEHNNQYAVPLFKKYFPALWNGIMMYARVDEGSNHLSAWYIRNSANRIISQYGSPPFFYQDEEESADIWRHAVFTVDSTEGRIYFDGVLQDVQPWDGQPMAPTNNLAWQFAGKYENPDTIGYRGALDDITIWGVALTEEEVSDLYIQGGYDQQGCTDSIACNFDWTAVVDNGTCIYPIVGEDCFDGATICSEGTWWNPILQQCFPYPCDECPGDFNDDNLISISDLLGMLSSFGVECAPQGCTDPSACNYDAAATEDDGSCVVLASDACGCMFDCSGQIINDYDNDGNCELPDSDACADTIPPVIQIPASDLWLSFNLVTDPWNDEFDFGSDSDFSAWIESHGGASATDACSAVSWSAIIEEESPAFVFDSCLVTEPLLVTFTATDACGNSSSTQGWVSVFEVFPPVLAEEASNITVECDGSGNQEQLMNWLSSHGGAELVTEPGVVDAGVVWTNDFSSLSDGDCGTQSVTVTFTATNGCGSSVSTTATFTIEDSDAPVLETPLIEDGSGDWDDFLLWQDTLVSTASFSDNCSSVTVTNEVTFGDFECLTYVVLIAEDACGNLSYHISEFTFIGACGDPMACNFVEYAWGCSVDEGCVYPGFNEAGCPLDCDGNLIEEYESWDCELDIPGCTDAEACNYNSDATDEDGSCVYTTLDVCGCIYDCSGQILNDLDNDGVCELLGSDACADAVPPILNSLAVDLTVECDGAGNDGDLQAWLNSNGGAFASDVCGGVTWSNDYAALSNDCGAAGAATVTFTATDDCGNTTSTTATFTIVDTTAPAVETWFSDAEGGVMEFLVWQEQFDGILGGDVCSWETELSLELIAEGCFIQGLITSSDFCGNATTAGANFEFTQADACADETACNYNPAVAGLANCSTLLESCIYGSGVPGDPCDDGNANTSNDVWDATGCNCEGTIEGTGDGSGPCEGETVLTFYGSSYALVEIGEQCWFAENLATQHFTNGDTLSLGVDCESFYGDFDTPVAMIYGSSIPFDGYEAGDWCEVMCTSEPDVCGDNALAMELFGMHYNSFAVVDERGLCPTNWHVSTDEDWMALESELGMSSLAIDSVGFRGDVGGELKVQNHWCEETGNSNTIGFSAEPGGALYDDCGYSLGAWIHGFWWSVDGPASNTFRHLSSDSQGIYRGDGSGLNYDWGSPYTMRSVRCVKD